jgi:hypothetical protein
MENPAPVSLFSTETLPCAYGVKPHSQLRWFSADSEARHLALPHPVIGAEDVLYKFNALGYRCPEFDLAKANTKALSVVSIGASEVMGYGLPETQSFPYLFCQLLEQHTGRSTTNWNLGVAGSSADTMTRTLIPALSVLKPDIVLFVFPFPWRREHINAAGKLFFFDRNARVNVFNKLKNRLVSPEYAEQFSANQMLSTDYSDQLNYFKNYQLCETFCEKHKLMWLFSSFHSSYFKAFTHLLKTENLISQGLWDLTQAYKNDVATGLARDRFHPGIKPNNEMAGLFFQRLIDLYGSRLQVQ